MIGTLLLAALAASTFFAARGAIALVVRASAAYYRAHGGLEWLHLLFWNPPVLFGAVGVVAAVVVHELLKRRRGGIKLGYWFIPGVAALFALRHALLLLAMGPQDFARWRGWHSWLLHEENYVSLIPGVCRTDCRQNICGKACTNELGFRGPVLSARKKPGTIRVALIGDSYTYGLYVDDDGRLDTLLGTELRRLRPAQGWEIGNYGVPGLNFYSYVKMLESVAPMTAPDLVVIGFLTADDMVPYDPWDQIAAFGNTLHGALVLTGAQRDLMELEARRQPDRVSLRDRPLPVPIVEKMEESLRRLLVLKKRLGFHLIVYGYFGSHPIFNEAIEAKEIEFLSPVDLRWRDPGKGFAIPDDGHPTAAGNRIFAGQLAQAIAQRPRRHAAGGLATSALGR